jgi:hypothetical protein
MTKKTASQTNAKSGMAMVADTPKTTKTGSQAYG